MWIKETLNIFCRSVQVVVNAITASCASYASLACCAWSSGHCSNALSALIVTYESSTSPLKVIQVFVVPVVLYMIQLRYSKEIAQLHSVLRVKYWYHCQQIALDKRNISISLILSTINILYIIYQKGRHCWPIPRYVSPLTNVQSMVNMPHIILIRPYLILTLVSMAIKLIYLDSILSIKNLRWKIK